MNYNTAVVISAIICAIISMFISYYLVLFTMAKRTVNSIHDNILFTYKYISTKYINTEEREKND